MSQISDNNNQKQNQQPQGQQYHKNKQTKKVKLNPKKANKNKVKFLQPYEILENYSQLVDEVKIVTKPVPFLKGIQISDISVNAGGNDEDKIYCFNQDYRLNIRRGNSIITVLDKNGNIIEDLWARKGLPKFFDLTREYIEYNLGEVEELTTFGIKNQSEHTQLHKIIFERAQNALEKGHQVQVLKMNKANGENCQISYFYKQNCWVIASKNVSMLCQYENDINMYKGERYAYAKLIAQTWFSILQKISKEQVESLKENLDNMTLVGEYVGNQDYQHLVKYEKINLNFFAFIDNESDLICLPPLETQQIFEELGLTFVKHQELGVYSNWRDLNLCLKQAYDTTAQASIEEEEEGSVLYLIQKNKDEKIVDKILSVCKLKTLEYRFYRKLREKLRNFISFKRKRNSKSKEELLMMFKTECQDLLQDNQSARPLEYYIKIGQVAFEYIENHYNDSDLVHEQYITFLSVLHYCIDTNQSLTPELLLDNELTQKLLSIPWSQYSTEKTLKDYKEIKKKQFVAQTNEKKKLYVFIPISVPGMGKTTLCDILKQNIEKFDQKTSFLTVSSDQIRKDLMDKEKLKNPNMNQDQLYEKTKGKYFKQYKKDLQETIQIKSQQQDSNNIFIFLDKNHPPNGIEKAIKDVKSLIPENYSSEIVGLIPNVENGQNFAVDDLVLPFSLSFIFNCLNRVQMRKEHPTLPGSGIKSGNIMVMFINMFRNVTLSDSLCRKGGLDRIARFYFHKENEDLVKNNQNIINLFQSVLNQTIPGELCKNEKLLMQFITQFEKENFEFPQISYDEIQNQAYELIKEILDQKVQKQQPKQQKKVDDNEKVKSDIIYQGIFAQDELQARECVLQYTKAAFENIQKIFLSKYDNKDILQNDLNLFQAKQHNLKEDLSLFQLFNINGSDKSIFKIPNDLHVTSLFIGGKNIEKFTEKELEIFQKFQEDRKHDMELQALAYVPNKIICALTDLKPSMLINNEYNHITIATNGWTPKMSNDILKKVFSLENMDKTLEEIKKGNLINQVHKEVFEYKDKLYDIFLIKPQGKFVIPGITKNFTNKCQQESLKQIKNVKTEIQKLKDLINKKDNNQTKPQESKQQKQRKDKNENNIQYKPKQEDKQVSKDIIKDNLNQQQIKSIEISKNEQLNKEQSQNSSIQQQQQQIKPIVSNNNKINRNQHKIIYKPFSNQEDEDHYYYENRQYKQKRRF